MLSARILRKLSSAIRLQNFRLEFSVGHVKINITSWILKGRKKKSTISRMNNDVFVLKQYEEIILKISQSHHVCYSLYTQSPFRFPYDFKKLSYHVAKKLQPEKLRRKMKYVMAPKWSTLAVKSQWNLPNQLYNSSILFVELFHCWFWSSSPLTLLTQGTT